MTRSQALAALRRALVPALVVAALVLGLVLTLLLTRPPAYESRVTLVASPVTGLGPEAPEFAGVVSVVMPAIPEIAASTDVLRRLDGGPADELDLDLLAASVAVELVPASGVGRVTVTTDDAATTSAVLAAVVEEVQERRPLEPVGRFSVIGSVETPPTQVRPDSTLAVGLAVVAAALAGLLAVAAVQVLRPVLLTVPDVEDVVRASTTPAVPVTSVRGAAGLDLLVAHLRVAAPGVCTVQVLPASGADGERLAATISGRLRGTAAPSPTGRRFSSRRHLRSGVHVAPEPGLRSGARQPAEDGRPAQGRRAAGPELPAVLDDVSGDGQPGGQVAVVTARLGRTTAEQLRAALLSAQASGLPTGAVAVR